MKFLFLYTELAEYFLKCCEQLAKHGEVHIVRWPVNPEAPFLFSFPQGVTVHDEVKKNEEELGRFISALDPDLIVCSGWIDKGYIRAVKRHKKKIPKVLALDTKWRGDLKQQMARLLSPFFITDRFTHAWVPGSAQQRYAQKLGFRRPRIHTGFYSCDLEKFNAIYKQQLPGKKQAFPRRFIYTGRYYPFKGLTDLWEVFAGLSEKERDGWELWCVGTGSLTPATHPHIKHFGFVQPSELAHVMAGSGVFVLPSRFEPWAVVVHEFAGAGFPLLLSSAVGAAETFLKEGENGYAFKAGNINDLREKLKRIIALPDKELILMAERSHSLAQRISPEKWASTALTIAGERNY